MKYITIEYRFSDIQTSDIPSAFEHVNRDIKSYRTYLGNDFIDLSDGQQRIEKIRCPFCNIITPCFLESTVYSQDNRKRILSVHCTDCNKRFDIFQESIDDSTLN